MRDPRLYDAAAASRGRSWDIELYVELARQARPPVLEIVREELVLRPWREPEIVDALEATGWDWQAPAWNPQRAPRTPSDTILVGRATRRFGGG